GSTLGNNRLTDINPADIESINIINGAAAAAQYGSRASNGVVLITTKKGKNGAPKITFTTSYNVNELRKKAPITTYGKQFGSSALRLYPIQAQGTAPLSPGQTVASVIRDGVTANLYSNLTDVTRYDYQDYIFRTGTGADNNLSISGGNDKTHYYTSFAYSKNEGIIRSNDFTRYNFRTRLEQRLAGWAKLSAGLSYTNAFTNEKAGGGVFYSPINSINITNNIWDISKRDLAGNLQGVEYSRINPLSTIEDMNFTQSVNRTSGNLQFNLTPLKGLGIDWVIGVDAYSQVGKGLIKPYPYAAVAGLPSERYPSGYASNASNTALLFNSDFNISYERQFLRNLKFNAVVGTNYQFQRADLQVASGQGLAPFIETVSGATSTTVAANYGLDRFNLSGVFAQATLGIKNLLFLTGAIRRDQSSKFSPSQRTQTYPKFSASFVVSDLAGWKNSIKLRSSWGRAGNFTGIGSYDRFWQFLPVPFQGKNTIVPSAQLANPNVRPERMTEIEFGADAGFWNDRVTLGVSVYQQKIEDLVVNRLLSPSEGGLSIVNNVGQMENKGLEIAFGATPAKTDKFNWNFTFIYSRNRNKVTKLGTPTIAFVSSSGASTFLVEGAPASVFYGTAFARDANGNEVLTPQGFSQSEKGRQNSAAPLEYAPNRDASGQPTGTAIRKIIGNPNPNFTGSFANSLSYKKLSLNFLLDFVQGVDIFNADKRTRQGVGIGDYAEKELKGELPRGWIFSRYLIEEWRIDEGSFVKLREVGLNYNLGKVGRIHNAGIGISGRNLFSWDNYSGYDPETNYGGNSDIVRGVDFGNIPIPRTYRIQLMMTF
ncbi:MAG: SusC/RagA family TonB-linked outer membrane protein, partial [Candidatus Nephrothrix sp. EaCA]